MKDASRWLAVCIVGLAAAGSTSAHAQDAAARAEAEYAAGHYVDALALFEARAAAGDSAAAEMAGQMLYRGGTVYGPAVARDRERARGYLQQAARDGRPAARFLVEHEAAPVTGETEEEYVPGPAGC